MTMRSILFLLAFAAGVPVAAQQVPPAPGALTLDPQLYAEALRAVQEGTQAPPSAPSPAGQVSAEGAPGAPSAPPVSTAPGVDDWQAAQRDAGTELGDIRLLVLLQRLNPLDPPSARAEDYAEALRLHHLMQEGNPRACLTLARACREGHFESGLLFIRNEALARVLEARASAFQLPAPLPQSVQRGDEQLPAGS